MASGLATAVKMDVAAPAPIKPPRARRPALASLAPSAGLRVPAAPSGRHGHPQPPSPPLPTRVLAES